MKSWYYSENSKPQGPFELGEIKNLILAGKINEHTFVLNEQEGDWQPANRNSQINTQWFLGLDEKAFSADIREDANWIFLILQGKQQKQFGPFNTDSAKNFVQEHRHELAYCYVWQEGWAQWRSVQQVGELMLTKLKTEQKDLLLKVTEI